MKIDGNAEDELVSLYIDGAEAWIGNYLGRPIAELETVPADIKIAILKLVSFHYETRNLGDFRRLYGDRSGRRDLIAG